MCVVSADKSLGSGEGFMLPSIKDGARRSPFQGVSSKGGKGSPFKGFLDTSLVTQKIRKNLMSQDGTNTKIDP